MHLSAYKTEFRNFIKLQNNDTLTTKLTINENDLFVNNSEIVWEDDNNEVYYKGKLYDVVSLIKQNDKIILSLLSDENEQKFKDDFASIYDNDSLDKTDQKPMKLLKQFLSLKYIAPESAIINVHYLTDIVQPFTKGNFEEQNVLLSQETPPPNFS